MNSKIIRKLYPAKFEVYLISTKDDKPIYAGQGKAGFRAQHHSNKR